MTRDESVNIEFLKSSVVKGGRQLAFKISRLCIETR